MKKIKVKFCKTIKIEKKMKTKNELTNSQKEISLQKL